MKYTKKYGLICEDCNTLTIDTVSIDIPKNFFDLYINLSEYYYCDKCGGYTYHIDVDSRIARAVKTLRSKGYNTKFSCAGHARIDSNDPKNYIINFPYISILIDKGDKELGRKLKNLTTTGWYYTIDPYYTDKAAKCVSDTVEYISLRYRNKTTDELKKFAMEHDGEGMEVSKEILEFIKNDFKEACDNLASFLEEALS